MKIKLRHGQGNGLVLPTFGTAYKGRANPIFSEKRRGCRCSQRHRDMRRRSSVWCHFDRPSAKESLLLSEFPLPWLKGSGSIPLEHSIGKAILQLYEEEVSVGHGR